MTTSEAEKKVPYYERVANMFIEKMEKGTAPWQKPWKGGEILSPYNHTTGKSYRGINALFLMAAGKDDPRWMTYRQAQSVGAQVRAGEAGAPIVFWQTSEQVVKRDEHGKPVLDKDGKEETEQVKLERPRAFWSIVFNGEQIDGLPAIEKIELTEEAKWEAIQKAEEVLAASGATVNHSESAHAYYSLRNDSIHLPNKNQFDDAAGYYQTAHHELAHWTGHSSRLDRDLGHPFGSKEYAKEELVAEIACVMIGGYTELGFEPREENAAYVAHWVKALKEDPKEIFRAAAAAEKVTQFLVKDLVQEQTQQLDRQQEQEENMLVFGLVEYENGQSYAYKAHSYEEFFANCEHFHTNTDRVIFEKTTIGQLRADGNDAALSQELRDIPLNTPDVELYRADYWPGRQQDGYTREPLTKIKAYAAFMNQLPGVERSVIFTYASDEEARAGAKTDELLAQLLSQLPSTQEVKEKVYITVPFSEKDEVKALGAKWDRGQKSWYIPEGVSQDSFAKWLQPSSTDETTKQKLEVPEQPVPLEKEYLAVPYGERALAKAAGAVWDPAAKSWYKGPGADHEKLYSWAVRDDKAYQDPPFDPREEFTQVLLAAGCITSGEHPIMDGNKHRIPTEGDRGSSQSGFYVGHLDGRPAGYVKNNRTGAEAKWKYKGYSLTDEEKAQLQAVAAQKAKDREKNLLEEQQNAANRVAEQLKNRFIPATGEVPYLTSKGIGPTVGTYTDDAQKTLCVPVMDIDGKVWSMQYIQDDGTKRFAKNGKKEGCCHLVGCKGVEALAQYEAIIISEGYATANSISEALQQPVIATFDSGNLKAVALECRAKWPDKFIIIAGDDDKHLLADPKVSRNVGKEKAEEAASVVGGMAILPTFAPGEQRKDLKGFTDFNDLAVKSSLGKAAVAKQISAAITRIRHDKQLVQQRQRKGQGR